MDAAGPDQALKGPNQMANKLKLDLRRVTNEQQQAMEHMPLSPHQGLDTRMPSPGSYASKHLAKNLAMGKSPRLVSTPRQDQAKTQPDATPAHSDQGSNNSACQTVKIRQDTTTFAPEPSGTVSTVFHVPKIQGYELGPSSGASCGQHSTSSTQPVASIAPKTSRQPPVPVNLQRRGQHSIGNGVTSGLALFASTGPEAAGRFSDAHTLTAAAIERRELLKQYQAQKAAAKSKQVQQPGLGFGPSSTDDLPPAAARRFSSGAVRVSARPPVPVMQQPSKSVAPLLPCEEVNSASQDATNSPPHTKPHRQTDILHLQSARPPPPGESSVSNAIKTSWPAPGRLSLPGATPAAQLPLTRAPSPSALYAPRSIGPGSSGGGDTLVPAGLPAAGAPISNGGSGGVAAALPASAGSLDLRSEIKGLKLQELQWRYINARMEVALRARRQQGGHALAACMVAMSHLERNTAVLSAQRSRQQLQQRVTHAAQTLEPLLGPFMQLQIRPGNPDSVLDHVAQGLLNSLTRLPLVCGAVCGDLREANLDALEHVMNRGVQVLSHVNKMLHLLHAAGSGSWGEPQQTTIPLDANNLRLPTASILTQLVTHLKAEVEGLNEVMRLLDVLKSKQLLISSYQAQLVQTSRLQQQRDGIQAPPGIQVL